MAKTAIPTQPKTDADSSADAWLINRITQDGKLFVQTVSGEERLLQLAVHVNGTDLELIAVAPK